MTGLNKHFEFQARMAGLKTGGGQGAGGSNEGMMGRTGETPDDIPDIGSMIPIDKAN